MPAECSPRFHDRTLGEGEGTVDTLTCANDQDQHPLHFAAGTWHAGHSDPDAKLAVTKYLAAREGAEGAAAADKFQQTALHLACYVGKAPAIVAFLADLCGPEAVNAKHAKGMTALDCAREKGHEDVAAVLAARGGKTAAELDAAGEPEATKKPKSATKGGNAGAVAAWVRSYSQEGIDGGGGGGGGDGTPAAAAPPVPPAKVAEDAKDAFYLCVHPVGVGYRNSPDLNDRCDTDAVPGVMRNDVVEGTASADGAWFRAKANNKWLPLENNWGDKFFTLNDGAEKVGGDFFRCVHKVGVGYRPSKSFRGEHSLAIERATFLRSYGAWSLIVARGAPLQF